MLKDSDPDFRWEKYQNELQDTLLKFGIRSEFQSKGKMDARVRNALLKDSSTTKQIDLSFANHDPQQKIRIKLEVDVFPPQLSGKSETLLEFPVEHFVSHQNLAPNFALKIHALLCRHYLKGRDWFDFSWYVGQRIFPNLPHLREALLQTGPWKGNNDLEVNMEWLARELSKKTTTVDWESATVDVKNFIYSNTHNSLHLWNQQFFEKKLNNFMEYSTSKSLQQLSFPTSSSKGLRNYESI